MDLTRATMPGAIGDLHCAIGAFTGWDQIAARILPVELLLARVARKIVRSVEGQLTLDRTITFSLPGDPRVWRIRLDGACQFRDVVPWRGSDPYCSP